MTSVPTSARATTEFVAPAPYRATPRRTRRHTAKARSSFRPDIEGLRGIAVLLVVAYHAGVTRVSSGYVGVDVFFVLSGYLITGILVEQIVATSRLDYAQFFARRMRRLLPAATLTLLVVLAATVMVLGPMERIELSESAIATALFSNNVYFMAKAVEYFATSSDTNPLLHTWSLAVEEQFYLVWPWLVYVGWRLGRSRRGLAVLLTLFSVASFVGCVWLTHKKQPWAFFGTPARAWEFGIGGIAVLLPMSRLAGSRAWMRWLGWSGLLLVIGAAMLLPRSVPFPGAVALIPTLGTSLALMAGAADGEHRYGVSRLLTQRWLQWLGGRSYSWYLWHWPVLVFAAALWPTMSGAGRVVAALFALGLAAASTSLVENPIRFLPRLASRPWLSIALGLSCAMVGAIASYAVHRHALMRGGTYWHAAKDKNGLDQRRCTTDFDDARVIPCTFGDTASVTTVVLLGDSHAAQWFSAIDSVAHRRGWKLVTMTKYSCPVARVAMHNAVLARLYTECAEWREAALRKVIALRPAGVIIGEFARSGAVRVTPSGGIDSLSVEGWRDGLRSTLVTLDSAGVRTLLLYDAPAAGHLVPACLSRAQHLGAPVDGCGVSRVASLDSLARRADTEAAHGLPNVSLLDLSDVVCAAKSCAPIRDGVVVFRDANHLAEAFVQRLSWAFDAPLQALVVSPAR
jgi:peptidoglycan/LPS O-acetylase OafA/YrhL